MMDGLEDDNFEGLTEDEIKELSEFLDPEVSAYAACKHTHTHT